MENNENKKSNEALPDEAMDKVAGGTARNDIYIHYNYTQDFQRRNWCSSCNNYKKNNCLLNLGQEGLYKEFNGNPNATCQYKM